MYSVGRVLRMIADQCRGGSNIDIEIPEVGMLRIKNNIASVEFT